MTQTEDSTPVDDLLPLSRVDFLVLLVLTDGACHGYGIVKEIGHRTDGKLQILPGNLYAVMNRLMNSGLVIRAPVESQQDSDNRRRGHYQITPFGQRALAAEASALRSLVQQPAVSDLLEAEAS